MMVAKKHDPQVGVGNLQVKVVKYGRGMGSDASAGFMIVHIFFSTNALFF